MKRYFLIMLICNMLSVSLYADPIVSGFSIADPDSGFNALRNPALMSFQKKGSLSFLYTQSFVLSTEGDISSEGMSLEKKTLETHTKFNGTFSGSWTAKKGRFAYGLGIDGGSGDSTFKKQETEVSLYSTDYPVELDSNEDGTQYGFGAVMSASLRIDRKSSFGFALKGNVLKNSVNKNERKTNTAVPTTFEKDSEVESLCFSMEGGVGYYYQERNYGIAMMVGLGEYGFEKNEYSYDNPETAVSLSESLSSHYVQNDGVVYLVGGKYFVTPSLKVYVDLLCGFPYVSEASSIDENTNTLEKTETRLVYTGGFSTGLDYRFNSFLSLNTSFHYIYSKSKEYSSDVNTGETLFRMSALTLGADFNLSDSVMLITAVRCTYLKVSLESDINMSNEFLMATAAVGMSKKY